MKKTITTLALLAAGVAYAEEGASQTVLFDFGRTDSGSNTYQTADAINVHGVYVGYSQHTTLNNTTGSLNGIQGTYTVTFVEKNSTYPGYGVVVNPVPAEGEESSWKNPFTGTMPGTFTQDTLRDGMTLQHTHPNDDSPSLTLELTGLAKGTYSFAVFGAYTGKDAAGAGTVTLTQTAVLSSQSFDGTGWSAFSDGVEGTSITMAAAKGYVVNATGITVTEDNASISLTITAPTTGSDRTPLNAIQMTYTAPAAEKPSNIPEPATATLSLLALAGLAARRRRK